MQPLKTSFYDLIKLQPHPAQVKVLQDNSPNVVLASSRRAGKSVTAIIKVLQVALDFDNWCRLRGNTGYVIPKAAPAIVAIVCPTREMARTIYFKPMVEMLLGNAKLKALVKDINKTSLSISFYGNRPDILCGSTSDDGNTWRGKSIALLVADEAADIPFSAIDESLKPAMTSVKGSQMFILGSPKGQGNNTLWRYKVLCDKHPEYYSFHRFTILDNPYISKEVIKQELATKSPAVFAREYMADFSNFQGMIYDSLSEANKVTSSELQLFMNPKDGLPVYIMGVDHGSQNAAISVLAMTHDPKGGLRLAYVDGWQNKTGKTIYDADFKEVILRYAQKYQPRFLRPDPALPGTNGDILVMCKEAGLSTKVLSGFNKIIPGVLSVNDLIYTNKLVFLMDSPQETLNTVTGSEAFDIFCSYRYETTKDGSVNDQKIAQGINDHICDCVRYSVASEYPYKLKKQLACTGKTVKVDRRTLMDDPMFDPRVAVQTRYRVAS